MIHHKEEFLSLAPFPCHKGLVPIFKVFFLQNVLPFFKELLLVDDLIRLLPGGSVRSVGHALKMHHHGKRLVQHPTAMLTHLKGQVAVLTIGRRKPFVKAADLLPERTRIMIAAPEI